MSSKELNQLQVDHQRLIQQAQQELPVKLASLARQLGVEVISSTLPPGISGELRPDGKGGFVVRVNRHDSQRRQRFTVAHELAHFLLHKDDIGSGISDDVLYRSNLSDTREAEANRLAADILMPMQLVRDKLLKRGGVATDDVIVDLALEFGVSEAAMRIRLGVD